MIYLVDNSCKISSSSVFPMSFIGKNAGGGMGMIDEGELNEDNEKSIDRNGLMGQIKLFPNYLFC